MACEIAKDGRIFVIERKGAVKVKYPGLPIKTIARIAVNSRYTDGSGSRESQEGLIGFALDPAFDTNHWAYFLYASVDAPEHVLARWEIRDDAFVEGSRKVLLTYRVDRDVCCHFGGGLAWDAHRNLYVATGSNTGEALVRGEFQFMSSDERSGRSSWDAQRTAANTNDLRGKILRLHPEPAGTYTIPAGNLFKPGAAGTRPEIYTMGHRNPWHPTVDPATGWLYWGEVGPDKRAQSASGPAGFDELNQARGPGFFGWPYFVGDNLSYPIADLVKNTFRAPMDPQHPVNRSVNNTGLVELPPAQAAMISYSTEAVARWPLLGSGGGCAMGGPIYPSSARAKGARAWPRKYEGRWIVTDCSRQWILSITMDDAGHPAAMERLDVNHVPAVPVDMKVDAQGDLYVVEYGSSMLGPSSDTKIVRIEYRSGNRAPVAVASAERDAGTAPLTVQLSAEGSRDPDGDDLRFDWRIEGSDGAVVSRVRDKRGAVRLSRPGQYRARLTVTDPFGGQGTAEASIVVGNDPPVVEVVATSGPSGNASFVVPGAPIEYSVRIHDTEDGSVRQPTEDSYAVSIDYVGDDFDVAALLARKERDVTPDTNFAVARGIIDAQRCSYCHAKDAPSQGPSMTQLSARYASDPSAVDRLVARIRGGGENVWGSPNVMPRFTGLRPYAAAAVVRYMLSGGGLTAHPLPLRGTYVATVPRGEPPTGTVVIRAVYRDGGAPGVPSYVSTGAALLRTPVVTPRQADVKRQTTPSGSSVIAAGADGWLGFTSIDLTGIAAIKVSALAIAARSDAVRRLDLRIDSPDGPVIGTMTVVPVLRNSPTSSGRVAPGKPAHEAVTLTTSAASAVPGPLDMMTPPGGGAGPQGEPPRPLQVQIQPVEGRRDLYLRFSGPEETRLIIGSIQFIFRESPR